MDNLDRDIREAQRLGYGVHYGNYKADHPHTREVPADVAQAVPVKIRTCKRCGKEFQYDRLNGLGFFCSENCKKIQQKQNNADAVARYRGSMEPLICKVCGDPFIPTYRKQSYCSISCSNRAKNKLFGVVFACAQCGKEFKPRAKTSKYCCIECCNKAKRKKPVEAEENG